MTHGSSYPTNTDDLHRLAARQHGLVAGYQLLSTGWERWEVARLRRHHGWDLISSRVLRRLGSPESAAQRVCAAVLDAGPAAYLSHESAAAWWGHRGSRLENPIQVVTVRSTKRRSPLARVHRVRCIEGQWVTDISGVPVVRPELVALQLFAVHSHGRAERIVESLWSQRLLSGESIGCLLGDMGERGRNGTAGLRRFLKERGTDYRPPDSGLESRTQRILSDAGIRVNRQVSLGGEGHWSGRVDFLVVGAPLVIEVQSELHHSSLTDRTEDAQRISRLTSDGFVVVEVTDEMVWTDPARVVSTVREGIRRARQRQRVTVFCVVCVALSATHTTQNREGQGGSGHTTSHEPRATSPRAPSPEPRAPSPEPRPEPRAPSRQSQ